MSQTEPTLPVPDPCIEEARTDAFVAAGSAAAPLHIPGYEVRGELGRGGMGIVYEARQVDAKREVVLKTIGTGAFASALEVARFRYEAEVAASLDHPHVVPIYEVGENGGLLFYSMKRLTNGSLAHRLRRGPRLDPREAACLLVTVARAVQHAHEKGVIHRDLKPGNVLLDEHDQPHASDFGLARQINTDHSLGPTGAVLGTPEYAAPEQVRGDRQLTAAVDVYGLGAILYECLTGRPPFRGSSTLDTITRVQRDVVIKPRQLNPDISTDLEAICLRCLSKDPVERYATAEAVAIALERFLRGESPHDIPPVLGRLWKAITRPPEVPGLITEPALWYGMVLSIASHGVNCLLGLFGVSLFWVCVVFLVSTASVAGLTWAYFVRSPRSLITSQELNSAALHLGGLISMWVVVVLATLATPGGLAAPSGAAFTYLYPILAVIGGLGAFAHGITHWGMQYLFGLVSMLLALPMFFLPAWAPLLFGGYQALCYLASALVLPRYIPTR